MDLPAEGRADPSEFVNAYVRIADLLATREPLGDTKPRPTSRPSRKRKKLPAPKKKRAKEPPPEEPAHPKKAATTATPAEKVRRVCISSSPESSMPPYEEDAQSGSEAPVADEVGSSSAEPVRNDSELSPQLAAEVPGPDIGGADAAEPLLVEDISTADTVPDIEEQFQLAGRALQWLLCASKNQASVAACWSSAQKAARCSPRRLVLEELLAESADNARCHMQVHGVGGLVPCEILAAKGSDGQLKHRRGAYELWRELVRSCDTDSTPWFNIQFARWGAFLEELVKRAEAAYISSDIAKRRA